DKLEIALTRNPEPVNLSSARLLPVNDQQKNGAKLITFVGEAAPTPSGLSAAARYKLENLQLEQTIRNLQITVPNRR
ncbi:MAG: hypothetical protein JSS22_08690, partial [Proteobacteria bacterium]|nr:hypothetical protein [Pseudomonadota bacterium]